MNRKMAIMAKSNYIRRFHNKINVNRSRNDMVSIKFTTSLIAILTCIVITFKNILGESFIAREHAISLITCAVFVITVFFATSNAIRILLKAKTFVPSRITFFSFNPLLFKIRIGAKSIVNLAKVIIGFMSLLVSHSTDNRTFFFCKSFIPSGRMSSKIAFMMTMTIFGILVIPFFVSFSEARSNITTTAFTRSFHAFNNHTIHYTFKIPVCQEKSGELLESPTTLNGVRVISSQACVERSQEGSTTNGVSTNNNPLQECPARKGRYSLSTMDNIVNHSLNGYEITKLNSIPFTFKVNTLSKFELEKIIKQGLRDDMVKVIDGIVERQFNSCALRYVGSSTTTYALTTNGTATAVNTSVLNTYHIRNMMLELKKRNVPGFTSKDGDYCMIVSVDAATGLQGALESIFQYTETGAKKLLNGEIGRYAGCRFVEDSFASRYVYSPTLRTATAKSWAQAQSLDGYMFGEETVQEIVACPEEIRMKETTDYGRSHGLAWYMIAGWKIMWEPSGTGVPDTRIIKWDSAS